MSFPEISIKQGCNVKKPISILLVEDEVIIAMVLKLDLKRNGYPDVRHVTTGEMAIISATQNPPDIILMDIRLAGEIDGIEAAAVIKAESDIPVLYVTSYDDEEIRGRADSTKPIGFFGKPVDISKLKQVFDDIADGRI